MFWAHLRAHTRPERAAEFTHMPAEARLPSFGLGVLGPNAPGGTCEADVPDEQWQPKWEWGDNTVENAWKELCRMNRTRLCDLGVEELARANDWSLGRGRLPIKAAAKAG